jgi:epoxyqueuosine reductase
MKSIPLPVTPDQADALPAAARSPLRAFDAAALSACAQQIQTWGRELGFSALGIGSVELDSAAALDAQKKLEAGFEAWLSAGYHGAMDYMAKHGSKRTRPAELVPGTLRVISVRLDYLPREILAAGPAAANGWRAAELARLDDAGSAVVSVYARGRDYHKVLRQRLEKLAQRITAAIGPFGYRVFTDSAPVLEVELARRAQLGWRGKHTLLLHPQHGSFFFIGEIYVDVPLPVRLPDPLDAQAQPLPGETAGVPRVLAGGPAPEVALEVALEVAPNGALDAVPALPGEIDGAHCGNCTRCLSACPTGAIVAPYRLDARRCISYLTIELPGSIPLELRTLIGNRVYGCDDCQLVCPWNKFAQPATLDDFTPRHGLARPRLLELFAWSAQQFDERMSGSAIRRIGYERWSRNLAVGLGNALRGVLAPAERAAVVAALRERAGDASALVREHIDWALEAQAAQ